MGYHFIQSFAPGEVTPEQAHALGVELARRLFGDRFEAVIGTHLDKGHLHSHIVMNSVSCMDGRKYHSSPERYYNEVRRISDDLCRENSLSVIEPQGKGLHYAEWKAQKQGQPTIRGMMRQEVDEIMAEAFTYKSFLEILRKRGYAVKSGPKVQHTAIRPPGAKRFIRLDSLGAGYTEREIVDRIAGMRLSPRRPLPTPEKQHYRVKGDYRAYRPVKLHGFRALYFKYLYLLDAVRKSTPTKKAPFALKEEALRFERYKRQFRFLHENRIDTAADLSMLADAIQAQADALTEQRRELYRLRREGDESVSGEIDELTNKVRKLRRSLRLCGAIQADIPTIQKMSVIGGREAHINEGSKTYEKAHKARFSYSPVPHGSIPPEGRS